MRNMTRLWAGSLLAMGAAWPAMAAAACTFSDQPLEAPAVADKRNRLVLLGSDPASGEAVRSATVISLDVEYHIADFEPGKFELVVLANQLTPGTTTIVSDGGRGRNVLNQAHGKAHVCAPLRLLFNQDGVRWPLQLIVSVHKQSGPGSYMTYAQTQRLQFPSPDLSAKALQQQKASKSENYYLALDEAFDFYHRNVATYESCIDRFPETEAMLGDLYKGWTGRHAALFARIDALQLQRYRELVRSTSQTPETRMSQSLKDYAELMKQRTDLTLRRRCMDLSLVMNGEPREFIGYYLSLIDAESPQK